MTDQVRGLPSLAKGAGLRTLSLRSTRVRIPPPAPLSMKIDKGARLWHVFVEELVVVKVSSIPINNVR